MTPICSGIFLGFLVWFFFRYVLGGFYTVNQDERAVKTRFGRAARLGDNTTLEDPVSDPLNKKDRERYRYPLVPFGSVTFGAARLRAGRGQHRALHGGR